jgi:hypothetical protein
LEVGLLFHGLSVFWGNIFFGKTGRQKNQGIDGKKKSEKMGVRCSVRQITN